MTRRDVASCLVVLGLLLVCICLPGWVEADAPQPWIATVDKPSPVLEQRRKELPAAVSFWNPTPLSDELYRAVLISCTTYGVPECLALGLIEVESGFDADAVGPDGRDIGLFQIRSSNHAWLSSETGADPMMPEGNIECGVYMLSYLIGRYETVEAALTAYRWGHDNGDGEYANKVLRASEAWEEVYACEDLCD